MTFVIELLRDQGYILPAAMLTVTAILLASLATVHILLNKRESTAAVAWTGLVWLSPLFGAIVYVVLGINRIQRKAIRLRQEKAEPAVPRLRNPRQLPHHAAYWERLSAGVARVTGRGLAGGNAFEPLRNGDEAYPAMLDAIAGATETVTLMTYILDDDRWGRRFVDALVAAHTRGVQVRVLIDGIGARRGWGVIRALRRAGVPTTVFLWSWMPWKMALINLRNHRKLLIVDGTVGFTGGMNIREAYVHADGTGTGCDLHFRVRGPVLRQLQGQFAIDWTFADGEPLGPEFFPTIEDAGDSFARVVSDGPDEDLAKIAQVMFHAVSVAHDNIRIVTPYFLPLDPLTMALVAAAQRGVDVQVLLPETNEPQWMNRVTTADVGPLLEAGVRVGFKQGCFEHTKLMIVDEAWVLLGSSNWDPRSLRLNFELCVEVYDPSLAVACEEKLRHDYVGIRWLTLDDLLSRSVPRRLVDGLMRLPRGYM